MLDQFSKISCIDIIIVKTDRYTSLKNYYINGFMSDWGLTAATTVSEDPHQYKKNKLKWQLCFFKLNTCMIPY